MRPKFWPSAVISKKTRGKPILLAIPPLLFEYARIEVKSFEDWTKSNIRPSNKALLLLLRLLPMSTLKMASLEGNWEVVRVICRQQRNRVAPRNDIFSFSFYPLFKVLKVVSLLSLFNTLQIPIAIFEQFSIANRSLFSFNYFWHHTKLQ